MLITMSSTWLVASVLAATDGPYTSSRWVTVVGLLLFGVLPFVMNVWVTVRAVKLFKDPKRTNQAWIAIIFAWFACFVGWIPGLFLTRPQRSPRQDPEPTETPDSEPPQ